MSDYDCTENVRRAASGCWDFVLGKIYGLHPNHLTITFLLWKLRLVQETVEMVQISYLPSTQMPLNTGLNLLILLYRGLYQVTFRRGWSLRFDRKCEPFSINNFGNIGQKVPHHALLCKIKLLIMFLSLHIFSH